MDHQPQVPDPAASLTDRARTAAAGAKLRRPAETTAATPAAGPAPDTGRLLAAHTDAAAWYRAQLLASAGAGPRGYLTHRGLGRVLEPGDPWAVGYAPPRWTGLVDQLRSRGFTDPELLETGLGMTTRRGTVVDR